MGRLKQEHNFDPHLSSKKIYYEPGIGELGGMGIFQWTWDTGQGGVDTSLEKDAYFKKGKEQYPESRLAKYLKWCDENKKTYESSASELGYFWDKDKEDNKYFAKLKAGIDSWEPKDLNNFNREDVVYKWTAGYERGKHGANDKKYANEFYDKYAKKGGGLGKIHKSVYGGGGIKSWILKKLAGTVVGSEVLEQISNKLDNFPNLQRALQVVDYFDPISIFKLPWDKAHEIDAKIQSGEINPNNIDFSDEHWYGGGSRRKRFGGGDEKKTDDKKDEAKKDESKKDESKKEEVKSNTGKNITMIGDSLMVGLKPRIAKKMPDAVIECKGGMGANWGYETAKNLQASNKLHDTVVVEMGTNGGVGPDVTDPYKTGGDNLLNLVKDKKRVYWVNNYLGAESHKKKMEASNKFINELPGKYNNIKTIDWYGLASKNTKWFDGDDQTMRCHPNGEGYDAFSDLIVNTINNDNSNVTEKTEEKKDEENANQSTGTGLLTLGGLDI